MLWGHIDAAVSRENLAQVYEMRGDTKSDKKIWNSAGKANMVCANHMVHCSKIVPGVMIDYYFNNDYTKRFTEANNAKSQGGSEISISFQTDMN
jgi:hypothetical protein